MPLNPPASLYNKTVAAVLQSTLQDPCNVRLSSIARKAQLVQPNANFVYALSAFLSCNSEGVSIKVPLYLALTAGRDARIKDSDVSREFPVNRKKEIFLA